MSSVKSEAIESISVIPDRSPSTSIIKYEYVAPPQPPPAAFTCEYCGKEFNLKQYLIGHVIEIHGDTCMSVKPEPHSARPVASEPTSGMCCGESNSSAIDTDILQSASGIPERQRLTFTGSAEKRHNSNMSHEGLAEKKLLNNHVDLHSGVKQFNCDTCQKCFSREGNLQQHRSIHTVLKPHSCNICQKIFKSKEILKSHLHSHSDIKPFSCEICQQSFKRKAHLKDHLLIHSGIKPFSCEICQRSFSRKRDLKS
eukprot:960672_1